MRCQGCAKAPLLHKVIFEMLAGQDVAYRSAQHPVIPSFVHNSSLAVLTVSIGNVFFIIMAAIFAFDTTVE